jgi:hypothetical protein
MCLLGLSAACSVAIVPILGSLDAGMIDVQMKICSEPSFASRALISVAIGFKIGFLFVALSVFVRRSLVWFIHVQFCIFPLLSFAQKRLILYT